MTLMNSFCTVYIFSCWATWTCIAGCFCTFTPGVEQHVDVISWVVSGNGLAACASCFHCELISANDGCGWRIHWELNSVAVLFHNRSLPSVILQVCDQRNDDMCSLCNRWEWTWGGEMSCHTTHKKEKGKKKNRKLLLALSARPKEFRAFSHHQSTFFNLSHTCIPSLCSKYH